MYSRILSTALEDWVDDLTDDVLIDYALACRSEMLELRAYQGQSALISLAAEVAYDRALLKLCEAHGINVADLSFVHPQEERVRLEAALAAAGLDLPRAHERQTRPPRSD
jgi:hypothetical protein